MFTTVTTFLAGCATLAVVHATPLLSRRDIPISVTPHVEYSSSMGILGCKIDTNRVAYWPSAVDCDNICVKVTHLQTGNSVNLLKIDQSGGAYDISNDAWVYLQNGKGAVGNPLVGGGIDVKYQNVPPSECAGLLAKTGGKLPLSASNSMNYVATCLSQPNSWVAKNYVLYNINDPVCHNGVDETCSVDLAVSNQPVCASTLGAPAPLKLPVMNINLKGEEVPA